MPAVRGGRPAKRCGRADPGTGDADGIQTTTSIGTTPMTAMTASMERERGTMTANERLVIFASSLGTVFEWYDFYIYGTLAPILAAQYFAGVNPSAAFIFTLLAFAAGFAVRPFGALFFGRLRRPIGRQYTFFTTLTLIGV